MRMIVVILAAIVLSSALAGCSVNGPDGTVRQFLAATKKQDRKGMYEHLALSGQQGVAGLQRFAGALERVGDKPPWGGGELKLDHYGLFLHSISGFKVLDTQEVGDDAIVAAEILYSEKDRAPVFVREVKLGPAPGYGGGFLPSVKPVFMRFKGFGPLGPRYTSDPELKSGGRFEQREMTLVAEKVQSVRLKLHVRRDNQAKRWWIYEIEQPYWELENEQLEVNPEALANFGFGAVASRGSQAEAKKAHGSLEVQQAAAKIQEAQTMYLKALAGERALDRGGFTRLLRDAEGLAPSLNKEIAALWWHEALRAFYGEPTEATAMALDQAVKLDPSLGDPALGIRDTVFLMGKIMGGWWKSPRMKRQEEQEEAKRSKSGPPKEAPVVVVPYKELTSPLVLFVGAPYVRETMLGSLPSECRPSLISWAPPHDPRGSNPSPTTVTLEVALGEDGQILDKVEPGAFGDGRGVPPVQLVGGPNELAHAAETAVRRWKFKPLQVLGMPRQSLVRVQIPFAAKASQGSTPGPGAPPPSDEALPKFGEYVYVDVLPEVIARVPPVYPEAAKKDRLGGTVMIQALVGKDGTVKDTRVVKSVPAFDAAAVAAVRQWTFKPAMAKGNPLAVWVAVPVRFAP